MQVYIRIALRYLAGYLVLKGILPEDMADAIANDPELALAIGVAIGIVVEGAYALARKLGWKT
jgi:hypothetical protein